MDDRLGWKPPVCDGKQVADPLAETSVAICETCSNIDKSREVLNGLEALGQSTDSELASKREALFRNELHCILHRLRVPDECARAIFEEELDKRASYDAPPNGADADATRTKD